MLLYLSASPEVAFVPIQAVRKLLDAEFPGLKRVETSSLHRGVLGARHSFLAAPPDTNKLDVLAQVGAAWAPLRWCSLWFVILLRLHMSTCNVSRYMSADQHLLDVVSPPHCNSNRSI